MPHCFWSHLPHQRHIRNLYVIMEPSLALISHIAKDSFDFKIRLDKHCPKGNTLSTSNIKSLLTFNIQHDTTFLYSS